jgi:cellulose synthase/poly-beta-1,6-N-acetylglucosamine synthase-like glycosyltransferase
MGNVSERGDNIIGNDDIKFYVKVALIFSLFIYLFIYLFIIIIIIIFIFLCFWYETEIMSPCCLFHIISCPKFLQIQEFLVHSNAHKVIAGFSLSPEPEVT